MIASLKSLWSGATSEPWFRRANSARLAPDERERRFDAAKTTRLNRHQWPADQGATVNQDLELDLPTLRQRCFHEMCHNAFVEGAIATHVTDVVGPDGPVLEIDSQQQPDYAERLKRIYGDVAAVADAAGQHSLVELLQQDVRLLWWAGEFIDQLVDVDETQAVQGVTIRIHPVHPRRLKNPLTVGNGRTMMGIDRDRIGRPVTYYLEDFDTDQQTLAGRAGLAETAVPAAHIIHGFRELEPGQARGVPWLTPSLEAINDLRQCDKEILDAIRSAAYFGVMLYTEHHSAKYLEVNESVDMERRTIRSCPPGWKPEQMTPQQPTTPYLEYRMERQREIGRQANMPLMIVRLSSERHNYSSARFDGQRYDRGNKCLQAWLTRIKLQRLLKLIERQAQLAGTLPKTRPADLKVQWIWPVSPHVDPQKEANAWETLLRIGIVSEQDAAAAMGKNYETVVALRAAAKQLRQAAGLDEPAAAGEAAAGNAALTKEERGEVLQIVEDLLEDYSTRNVVEASLN
ncbi:MAG: phage portal protein [Phycisphaerales bacterium]|nr:phage portal protein [Phycisphaerales bacterium]